MINNKYLQIYLFLIIEISLFKFDKVFQNTLFKI